jgi:hypothetical protein
MEKSHTFGVGQRAVLNCFQTQPQLDKKNSVASAHIETGAAQF